MNLQENGDKNKEEVYEEYQENSPQLEAKLKDDEAVIEEELEEENEGKSAPKTNGKGLIYDLVFYVLLIFISLYVLPNYVIQRTIVEGTSMENTLHNGEQLFIEKVSYHFKELDRFDIVVFYPYGRENEEYYVKRVIGLPGEGVQIVQNEIYINGSLLGEDYGKDDKIDPGRAKDLIILGEDEYFVMGDNRDVSFDSRESEVGNVSKENIGGKVVFRIKPFDKIGTVK